MKEGVQRINKSNSWFFEKIDKSKKKNIIPTNQLQVSKNPN